MEFDAGQVTVHGPFAEAEAAERYAQSLDAYRARQLEDPEESSDWWVTVCPVDEPLDIPVRTIKPEPLAAEPMQLDGILAIVNSLPESERSAVLAKLKSALAAK